MLVRTHAGGILTAPDDRMGVNSMILCTDEGVPVAVAVDIEGRVWLHTANEPQFKDLMVTLGFSEHSLPKVTEVKI